MFFGVLQYEFKTFYFFTEFKMIEDQCKRATEYSNTLY